MALFWRGGEATAAVPCGTQGLYLLESGGPQPEHPDPTLQPGALWLEPARGQALLCMDGAAFWVMKYSQVSDSLRNDRDQSIPFQGVIFFPFTAPVSC